MKVLRILYQNKENPLCVKVLNTTTDYIEKHGRDEIFMSDMEGLLRAYVSLVCKECGVTHKYEDFALLREEIVEV